MKASRTKTMNLLDGFSDDGEVITEDLTPTRSAKETTKPEDKWQINSNFFLGIERRTDNHVLVPNKRIIEEQVVDPNDASVMEMMKLHAKAKDIFIYGPHGTGKTQLIKYVNAQLGRPLYQTQGHEQLEWDDMVGRYNPDENGNGTWDYGPLVLAMQEGGTFLLDEGVSVRQGILNGLNELLNSRELALTNHKGYEKVYPKEGFSIAITANPWDRYVGNNEMNWATLDRFRVRAKDYMNQATEARLLQEKYPGVPYTMIHQMTQLAASLRNSAKANPESGIYVISTRMLQTICDSIENFDLTLSEAINNNVMSIVRLAAPDQVQQLEEHLKNAITVEKP